MSHNCMANSHIYKFQYHLIQNIFMFLLHQYAGFPLTFKFICASLGPLLTRSPMGLLILCCPAVCRFTRREFGRLDCSDKSRLLREVTWISSAVSAISEASDMSIELSAVKVLPVHWMGMVERSEERKSAMDKDVDRVLEKVQQIQALVT